jgi:hypothetical protein
MHVFLVYIIRHNTLAMRIKQTFSLVQLPLPCHCFHHSMLMTTPTTTGQRWDKWNNRKGTLLLHYIGPSAFDIFKTLTDTSDANNYDKAIDRLT